MKKKVYDLRSSIEFLKSKEDFTEIEKKVDPMYELASIFASEGGGTPLNHQIFSMKPMLFSNVISDDTSVLVGLFSSRKRCELLLNSENIPETLINAVSKPITTKKIITPPCQEIVNLNSVDLSELPIIQVTPNDAGPFITLGLVMAKDPESNETNVSIHRMCVQGKDKLTIWMVPGRHLETLYLKAKEKGNSLPISINIGLDPAIYIASCCTYPLISDGFNELEIAGAIRGESVEVSDCISVETTCISNAEYVLEGEITDEFMPENKFGEHSLPEFLGYDGKSHPGLPVVKIKAITNRKSPIYQTCIGPGYEQSNLLAFGMEASIINFIREQQLIDVKNAYCSSAGGGQLLLFIQVEKVKEEDDIFVNKVASSIIKNFRMIKTIVLVDEDVNVYSEEEIWWAMTTRFQANTDIYIEDDILGFPLDPSQSPEYSSKISKLGYTSKVIFNCTVPYNLKEKFKRTTI